jgi:hypothetical protein
MYDSSVNSTTRRPYDLKENNSLFTLVCQDFGFSQHFVSKKKEEGKKFRSLEVRRKLIALKKLHEISSINLSFS